MGTPSSYHGTCATCGKIATIHAKNGHICSGCRTERLRERVRQAAAVLGNRCNRCGIKHPLQWDHINNDPKRTSSGKWRRVIHAEQAEMTKILKIGKSERLQLLCANCNWLKYHDIDTYNQPSAYGPKS